MADIDGSRRSDTVSRKTRVRAPESDRARIADALALGAVLVVGGYLRLVDTDLAGFAYDQARDAYVASGIVSGRSFPLQGVEVGHAHTWGPLYFYLLAVPFALSSDPSVAVAVLGALTLGSLWLTHRLGNTFFGAPVGVVAAALLATYPRVVIAENSLSNVTPVPFFTVAFFLSLHALVAGRQSIMIVPTLATLAALVQFHLSTLSLAVILACSLALFRPPVRLGHLCLALASALLLLSPYLIAEGLNGARDIRTFLGQAAAEVRPLGPWALWLLADDVLRTFPDLMLRTLRGIGTTWTTALVPIATRIETDVMLAGTVFVCAAAVVRSFAPGARGANAPAFVLLALWLVVPFVGIGQKTSVVAHHFELIYPGLCVSAAVLLSSALAVLARRAAPWLATSARVLAYVAIAAIVVGQAEFLRQFKEATRVNGAMLWEPGGSVSGVFEMMPIRYRAALVRTLTNDFDLDGDAFFHRVHGSRFRDLLDDNGYFFSVMERASRPMVDGRRSPLHYVVERDPTGATAGPVVLGPYTVAAYVPRIDYGSWRCADAAARTDTSRWTAIAMPTARKPDLATFGLQPFTRWPALPLECEGAMDNSASDPPRRQLVVSLRTPGAGSHAVAALSLNGTPLVAQRVAVHTTLGGHSRDAFFDLDDRIGPGRNALAFRIEGRGLVFDLDVYESGR